MCGRGRREICPLTENRLLIFNLIAHSFFSPQTDNNLTNIEKTTAANEGGRNFQLKQIDYPQFFYSEILCYSFSVLANSKHVEINGLSIEQSFFNKNVV